MTTSLRIGPEDRDERGFVKVPEPRSLADLMPNATTEPAPPAAPQMSRRELLIGGVLVAVAVVAFMLFGRTSAPTVRSAPTALAGSAADPTPASAPTTVAARLLVAFAAPDGNVLGAIESTRVMTATAHYGNAWVQANVQGSGLVWLRASDAPGLASVGLDLMPPTPASAIAHPVMVAQPPAPTEAPHCVTVGTTGNTIERCGYESLDALQATAQARYIEKIGGHLVPVQTATPYPSK